MVKLNQLTLIKSGKTDMSDQNERIRLQLVTIDQTPEFKMFVNQINPGCFFRLKE
jgi:hypothetical protein